MFHTCVTAFVLASCLASRAYAATIAYESYESFSEAAGTSLVREDWATVPVGAIEGQVINGIGYSYEDYFGHVLAVHSGGGWGFRLGVIMPNGVSNFSWSDQITFSFSQGLDSFGVMFAQGNYDGGGESIFAVRVGDGPVFYRSVPVVSEGPNIGYIGLGNLGGVDSVTIWRVQNGGDSVWTALHLDYAVVPMPPALAAGAIFVATLSVWRRRFVP